MTKSFFKMDIQETFQDTDVAWDYAQGPLKGNDFVIEIGWFNDKGNISRKRHKGGSIGIGQIANLIFSEDDLLGQVLSNYESTIVDKLDRINRYRMEPRRSYADIDKTIHSLGRFCVSKLKKELSKRPNPYKNNAESTILRKGFNHYGWETGQLINSISYRVKFAGNSSSSRVG